MVKMSENRCVMCNEVIPEGRMVCPICEHNVINDAYNPKTLARNKYEKRKIRALKTVFTPIFSRY